MKLSLLLNPQSQRADIDGTISPASTPRSRAATLSPTPATVDTPRSVRPKLVKDAAVFADTTPRGPINFPPHEDSTDAELLLQHKRFNIHPLGAIGKYFRHIPYNSDKKGNLKHTGIEAVEVHQYTFKFPGEEKEWTVMWDYRVGLVRITPFFKCLEYSKTTPARALNLNEGLRDISHSITGGALVAQGYWMPYDAAKAMAATFCYAIRHALTPIFGTEFLEQCIEPSRSAFGSFRINPAIIQRSADQVKQWAMIVSPSTFDSKEYARSMMPTLRYQSSPKSKARTSHPSAETPFSRRYSPWKKTARSAKRKTLGRSLIDDTDDDSSPEPSSRYTASPEISPKSSSSGWTAVNEAVANFVALPRSTPDDSLPATPSLFVSPDLSATPGPSAIPTSYIRTPLSPAKRRVDEMDDTTIDVTTAPSAALDSDGEAEMHSIEVEGRHYTAAEARAAWMMLQLSVADRKIREGPPPEKKTRRTMTL